MLKPYDLPMLPIKFDPETELHFYKKTIEANVNLEALKQKIKHSVVNESLIRLLTLHESVQSTRIEGTQITFSEMLEDDIEENDSWEKTEVRNYEMALNYGVDMIQSGYPLTERLIREIHKILMEGARGSTSSAGQYRKIQNYIGPTNNIKDASYIPPEPHKMDEYMTNLEHYINGHPYKQENTDDLHPLIKTAIVHAQFESIHPFLDGNGRLGRILIILYMLQTKLIDSPIFFLSEELERERFKYYSLLNGVKGIGKKEPDWKSWILFFLDAMIRMTENQHDKLIRAEQLFIEGLKNLSKQSTKTVWTTFFKYPISKVSQIEQMTDLAKPTIRKSINELVELNMIYPDDRKRNRRFYHYDLISILTKHTN